MKKICLFPFAVVFFILERIGAGIMYSFDHLWRFLEEASELARRWKNKL